MRDLRLFDALRIHGTPLDPVLAALGPERAGAFFIPPSLRVIATAVPDWDHVSVSTDCRTPTWEEMDRVKRMFFRDDETAMQLHVPPAEHLNHHPYCLHLWRPHHQEIPRPGPEHIAPPWKTSTSA